MPSRPVSRSHPKVVPASMTTRKAHASQNVGPVALGLLVEQLAARHRDDMGADPLIFRAVDVAGPLRSRNLWRSGRPAALPWAGRRR